MSREQKMQVRKLQEQQSIQPTSKQLITEVRIAALKAQLRVNSQLKDSDVMERERERLLQI